MFELVHELPGRMRLRATSLRGNPVEAAALTARLAALPGIRSARFTARTGSLLIHYDSAPACAARLRAALGLSLAFPAPARPAVADPALGRLADALLGHVAERLVGALAAALI